MRAAAAYHAPPFEITGRAMIPTALVRDLLSVGLLLEYRDSARARLERVLGPDTAATVLRRTLPSGH